MHVFPNDLLVVKIIQNIQCNLKSERDQEKNRTLCQKNISSKTIKDDKNKSRPLFHMHPCHCLPMSPKDWGRGAEVLRDERTD